MPPLRIAILTIGSLYWRDEELRRSWRAERLDVGRAVRVRVPTRYGRLSKKRTYTMTIAPDDRVGTAQVVPCRAVATEPGHLRAEAEALWRAECNKDEATGKISTDWGAVGAIFRDPEAHDEWGIAWTKIFVAAGAYACATVDAAGLIALPWPTTVDGIALDFDVLLVTSNVDTGFPSAEAVADAWIDQPGQEDYFFQNVRHGIRTPDDAEIWRRMENRNSDWVTRMAERFPEAVATLRANYLIHRLPVVRYFAPETWGAVDRFAHFHSATYQFPSHVRECVAGTSANFQRADLLRRIAIDFIPTLNADLAELDAKGFSHSENGQKLTAIVESSITSLYSSLDTARKVVTHVYKKCRGLPDSTRKTFQGAADGKLDPTIPEQIRRAFEQAPWYPRLRRLRDALTHVGPGSCHLDRATGRVMYFHDAVREGDRVTHIPDIFAVLDAHFQNVNLFLGQVFSGLLVTLKDDEVQQTCGFFGGRVYMRRVRPSEAQSVQSGRCESFRWFELPENPRCPLAASCEAYARRLKS